MGRTMVRQLAFGMVLIVFGTVVILALPGCRNHTPGEIHAYCQRWALKFMRFGEHQNPAAYRQDLILTCMARNNTPYTPQLRSHSPIVGSRFIAASDWFNTSVPEDEYTKTLGRDKADCIERGYVGQASQGENRGKITGFGNADGSGVGGSQSERYGSEPVFDNELFVACMHGAGWEFGIPPPEQKLPATDTPPDQGTATPVDSSAGPLRPPEI